MSQERRQFNRVAFDSRGHLCVGARQYECAVKDLSIHGALIELREATEFLADDEIQLRILLGDATPEITMELRFIERQEDLLRFRCTHIDLDSITHLRRLIELNLGDATLLERDFAALCR